MKTWPMAWFVGAVVVSAAAFANNGDVAPAAGRRECPHTIDTTQGTVPRMPNLSPTTFETRGIPEFNDCQRLIVDNGRALVYDSLHAIIATDSLDAIESRLDALRGSNLQDTHALAAAEIISDGDYDTLGLHRHRNCLYVWRELTNRGTQLKKWRAVVVRQGDPVYARLRLCTLPLPVELTSSAFTRLDVQHTNTVGGLSEVDYPAVARWGWDPTNRRQYMGFKCGPRWCEVGASDAFSPTPVAYTDPGGPAPIRRVGLVQGWYDEQLLAEMGRDNKLRPSQVLGIIRPHYRIDVADWTDYRTKWDTVTQIDLRAAYPTATIPLKYREFYRLPSSAKLPLTMYESLCYGTLRACGIRRSAQLTGTCGDPGPGDDPGAIDDPLRRWYTKIEGPGFVTFRCITRYQNHPATGVAFPLMRGTARWRWMANDEGTWKRCSTGCCESVQM